jgi:hypothetical protein
LTQVCFANFISVPVVTGFELSKLGSLVDGSIKCVIADDQILLIGKFKKIISEAVTAGLVELDN